MGGLGAGTCGDMRGADDTHSRKVTTPAARVCREAPVHFTAVRGPQQLGVRRYGSKCWECRPFSKYELVTRPMPFSQHGEDPGEG